MVAKKKVDFEIIPNKTNGFEMVAHTIDGFEMVGIVRSFNMFRSHLSDEYIQEFDDRLKNSYDIEDNTNKGTLWKIYRDFDKLIKNNT